MKKIIMFSLMVITSFITFANEKETIKGSITEVTVYAQGAQIHNKGSFTVKPGITELIIEGVSPYIDAKSLQVKATGSVVLLDSKYRLYYPKPEPVTLDGLPLKVKKDIMLLEDSIKNMNYDIQEIQDEIDVLNSTKSILSNNGAIRGQGKVNDSINLLKQAIDYYSVKMMEINKKLQVLNRRKSEKLVKRAGMDERLKNLQNYQNNNNLNPKNTGPIHQIVITLSSKEVVSGKLSYSYLVSQAGWTPMYDLRSEGISGKINLTYKAHIYQNSGLDWENVKLNVSTNNPYQNKTKPTLHPWYVDYYTYRNDGYKKQNMNAAPSMAREELSEKGYSYSNTISTGDMEAQTAAEFVQVVRQLTSAEFKIDLPYSIKSNNEQHMVLIKTVDLDANYKYYTVPKLDQSVYLVAQITKLDELGLVPASANIFFDGSYIGETYIDPTSMQDTLDLSLGRDP
ncbi:MAG: mucoidy inhibitor MuiA family protein, partial [Bacteroidetes bacterium]